MNYCYIIIRHKKIINISQRNEYTHIRPYIHTHTHHFMNLFMYVCRLYYGERTEQLQVK